MTPNVRFFATEAGATEAHKRLVDAGFEQALVVLPSGTRGQEEAAVESAIRDGLLPVKTARLSARNLKQGRAIVAVRAPFGMAVDAIEIMEAGDVVETEVIDSYRFTSPAPLSEALGLPVLANYTPSTGLVSNSWTFSGMFGMGLLTNNAAPFSSVIKFPLLSKPKKTWKSSFGFPMLINSAAPFSSLFSLRLLSKPGDGEWKSSFGFPLLLNKAAPFSSLFGLKELVGARGEKK